MQVVKQWNLITMNGQDGNPLSFDQTLRAFFALLKKCSQRDLAQTVSEISGTLYNSKDVIEANRSLVQKYAPLISYHQLLPFQRQDGSVDILFTRNAIWILNSLLTFNPFEVSEEFSDCLPIMCFPKNKIYLPPSLQDQGKLPIAELFLLANQLISHLQNEIPEASESISSKTQFYFSYMRVQEDAVAAIGKSRNLFNTTYFNQKMLEMLGISVEQLSDYLLVLLTLVLAHNPLKLEPDVTLRRIIKDSDKQTIIKLLDLLSIGSKSVEATQSQIAATLRQDFLQDTICRGKPFLKINQRYLCLRPDLLIHALGNFPYFYLLKELPEEQKEEFFREFGIKAFEQYIACISKKVLGSQSCEYFYRKKPHRGNRSGDRHFVIHDMSRVIVEIKSSRENDEVRLGSEAEIIDKFIFCEGTKEKPKGVLQLVKDAAKFRGEQGFAGDLFTMIIFYGRFPATPDFDKLVQENIEANELYQGYLTNKRNFPTVWLSIFTFEMIFSAVAQGASLEELLKRLVQLPPSKTAFEIGRFMIEKGFKASFAPLFSDDIRAIQETGKRMISI